MNNIRVGSMFAGIGGICLAFKQAGFEIVWANEKDGRACNTYRRNFGNSYLQECDISKVDPHLIPDFDILTAGFPCQPFSIAGKQRGFKDPRGNMFFEIVDSYKNTPQTYDMNQFYNDEFEMIGTKKVLLLTFEVTNKEDYLVYDYMSYITTMMSESFPHYHIIGELIGV